MSMNVLITDYVYTGPVARLIQRNRPDRFDENERLNFKFAVMK